MGINETILSSTFSCLSGFLVNRKFHLFVACLANRMGQSSKVPIKILLSKEAGAQFTYTMVNCKYFVAYRHGYLVQLLSLYGWPVSPSMPHPSHLTFRAADHPGCDYRRE